MCSIVAQADGHSWAHRQGTSFGLFVTVGQNNDPNVVPYIKRHDKGRDKNGDNDGYNVRDNAHLGVPQAICATLRTFGVDEQDVLNIDAVRYEEALYARCRERCPPDEEL